MADDPPVIPTDSSPSRSSCGAPAPAWGEAPHAYAAPAWFKLLAETCLDAGEHALCSAWPEAPASAWPMRWRRARQAGWPVHSLESLSNFYSCRYGPVGPDAVSAEAVARWARAMRATRPRPDRIRFDALDEDSGEMKACAAGLRRAGYLVETWPQFENWYLPVAGLDFDGYWAGRDARLRNTIARKARQLARAHRVTWHLFERPEEAEAATAEYEAVYAASWKPAEPYPRFIPALLRAAFAHGVGTVGVLCADGHPVAAQIWLACRGQVTIFKLSHRQDFARYSPGSVLTYHMMQSFLARGDVDEIDFGRGGDAYKRLWLPRCRLRWGVAGYDPLTPAGAASAARNLLPRLARQVAGQIRRRIRA